jgi:hypothetical protein
MQDVFALRPLRKTLRLCVKLFLAKVAEAPAKGAKQTYTTSLTNSVSGLGRSDKPAHAQCVAGKPKAHAVGLAGCPDWSGAWSGLPKTPIASATLRNITESSKKIIGKIPIIGKNSNESVAGSGAAGHRVSRFRHGFACFCQVNLFCLSRKQYLSAE